MNNDDNKCSHSISYPSNESGFTLIELMISLVLGLLISAAVMQVYLINIRTLTVQQSASEVQDSTIFSLQAIDDRVRIANLGNPITNITDLTDHGGIVLTGNNLGDNSYDNTGYLTVSAGQTGTKGDNGWTGLSNTDIKSDQLTIQYKNITPNDLYDCEGGKIEDASEWVIERYFVRKATEKEDLVLACDAGRVTDAGVVSGFGDNGEVIVAAVDQFKVLLGAQTDINNLTYLPAETYLKVDKPTNTGKPAITTVKLGVIVRSSTPLIENPDTYKDDKDKGKFTVLGAEHTLKTASASKNYYRRSYESTILLRNARVMSVSAVSVNTK